MFQVCKFRRVGCRWPKCKKKMRECDRGVHEDVCKKRIVPCGLGCGEMIPFADVELHRKKACSHRRVHCTRQLCVRKVARGRALGDILHAC